MMVARRTPGPAYANLQGRKPREVWSGPRVRRYRDFGVGGVWSRFADRRFGTRSRGGRIQPVGWVELFAKPIIFAATLDGYRFAPPILATSCWLHEKARMFWRSGLKRR
jgi:hypothetical protein